MQLLLIGLESLALIVGSLATAILLCWLLWFLFRSLRHPALAAVTILVLVALACTGHLPASQFLQMMLAFATLGTIPLWTEGRAWRRRFREDYTARRPTTRPKAAPMHVVPKRANAVLYPALIGCISEDREAERAEIRRVAARIWRETYQPQFTRPETRPSFALRRRVLRAAKFAMSGKIPAHH